MWKMRGKFVFRKDHFTPLKQSQKGSSKVFSSVGFFFLFLNHVCSIPGFPENSWWIHLISKHSAVFWGQSLTCWAWEHGYKSALASLGPADLSPAVCCSTNHHSPVKSASSPGLYFLPSAWDAALFIAQFDLQDAGYTDWFSYLL